MNTNPQDFQLPDCLTPEERWAMLVKLVLKGLRLKLAKEAKKEGPPAPESERRTA